MLFSQLFYQKKKMYPGTSFIVNFNLRSKIHGDAIPIVYGSIKELGNGDPNHGIPLNHVDGEYYNYSAAVHNNLNKFPKNFF